MKIISVNIGVKLDNHKEVVGFLQDENADIVCLQEVSRWDEWLDSKYNKKKYLDQALCQTYPYSFWWWLFTTDKLWTKNAIIGWIMEQGNYIISKYPITQWKQLFYHQEFQLVTDRTNRQRDDHGRAFTISYIDSPEGKIQVINVHGIWSKDKLWDKRTQHQIDVLLETIDKSLPCVIVWDFNLLPETDEIKRLENILYNCNNEYAIKSTRPKFDDGLDKGNMVVDYCFTSKKIQVNSYQVPDISFSDHLPLIAEFNIH